MTNVSRTKQHDLTMQTMYAFLILETTNKPLNFEEVLEVVCDTPYADIDIYVKEVLLQSIKHQREIINIVEPKLNKWTFDRLNTCSQAILITTCAEYFYMDLADTDRAILINNAVKLAKKYGDDKDYRFINAVLDNILHGREK